MASIADVYAEVKLDLDRGAQRKLSNQISRIDTQTGGKRAGANFSKSFSSSARTGIGSSIKGIIGPLAAAFAAVKIGGMFKGFIAEAREAESITRVTAAIIKSTGGAAKVSAADVGVLSESISNKIGVDDELIQQSANLLLTFKNVRNEAGQGAKIFDRATAAAQDLSAAGFGDAEGAAKMLGKALNDPEKGLTALGRAGVTFTDQQKAQIKALVASGKVLEAQKVILGEVESQVGGAAAAAADPMAKLGVVVGNLKEDLGRALLPTVSKVAGFLSDKAIPVFKVFFGALSGGSEVNEFSGKMKILNNVGIKVREVFQTVAKYVKVFVTALSGNSEVGEFEGGLGKVNDAAIWLRDAIGKVADFVTGTLFPALQKFGGYIKREVVPVVIELARNIKEGLSKAFDTIREKFEKNREKLGDLWTAFKKIVDFIVTEVVPKLGPVLKVVLEGLGTAIGTAIDIVAAFVEGVQNIWKVAKPVFEFVTKAWLAVVGFLVDGAAKAFGWVPEIGDKLKAAAREFGDFKDAVNRALDGIESVKDIKLRISETIVVASQATAGKVPSGGKLFAGNANGTMNWPGGMSWVGERGPELVNLPKGSQVFTASQSAAMAKGAGGGVTFTGDITVLANSKNEMLRELEQHQRLLNRR